MASNTVYCPRCNSDPGNIHMTCEVDEKWSYVGSKRNPIGFGMPLIQKENVF